VIKVIEEKISKKDFLALERKKNSAKKEKSRRTGY
jgi:hypothetical protein